jgi:L-lactate dehydrogenase complex protein LldG
MNDPSGVMSKVRRALGRNEPLTAAPIPPAIADKITRLAFADGRLPELFAARATANKMHVDTVPTSELLSRIVALLQNHKARRIAVPDSESLDRLGIPTGLCEAGLEVARWNEMTLDALYDFDCAVTDIYKAVAETGSLVMRSSPKHGRALSLVPPMHIAIVEAGNFLPDLIDLFALLREEGNSAGITIISGPSKTADIELNLVTGVHGPGEVQVFIVG